MNTILTILQWAIPSGGIGAAITWFANRKIQKMKATKKVHDTFHTMYNDVSCLLEETQKKYETTCKKLEALTTEYARTRRSLNRLSSAIEAIQLCPYRDKCPVRNELSLDGSNDDELHNGKTGNRNANSNTTGHSDHGKSDDRNGTSGYGAADDPSCKSDRSTH